MEDNLVFLYEYQSNKLAQYLRRKFGKKIGSDEKSLIRFFDAIRKTLWFYREAEESSAVIGIEFLIVNIPDKETSVGMFLITYNQKSIEIKNAALLDSTMRMFGPKLMKDGRIFFHWKHIEEFEEKLNNAKKAKGPDPERSK